MFDGQVILLHSESECAADVLIAHVFRVQTRLAAQHNVDICLITPTEGSGRR